MPSFPHEVLVELFRNCGELAPTLLASCGLVVFPHDQAESASIDLSQVVPTEYRADAVMVLRDRDRVSGAIVVEVQLWPDRDKQLSWPVYVAALRARLGCPVVLLVLAPDPAVARWARTSIDTGHPGFVLTPLVIELEAVPRVTDGGEAARLPELAVLSVMAHPEIEVASAAIAGLTGLPSGLAALYFDVIMAALPQTLRQTLEARMKGYVYQSEFARGLIDEGREVGLQQGRDVGLRSAALALLQAKLDGVTPEDEAALGEARDEATWIELIGALGRATSAPEIRSALWTARKPR